MSLEITGCKCHTVKVGKQVLQTALILICCVQRKTVTESKCVFHLNHAI